MNNAFYDVELAGPILDIVGDAMPIVEKNLIRKYLQNGYFTVAENIVCEDGKIYQIICAEYDGEQHDLTEIERELGKINISSRSPEFIELLNSAIAKNQKKRNGLLIGGAQTKEIDEYIKELEKLK